MKYKPIFNRLFLLFHVLFFGTLSVYTLAQDEAAIRPVIKAGDLKKLEKAESYKEDADKLIEEASNLNMEILNVQSDPDLDEKAVTKKSAALEAQAQQKQIDASALYEKSNEIKFILYKEYLDAFWKEHSGEESEYINAKLLEEQASDVYFQATSYRIDAKKMETGFAKVEKLSEANNLESEAIQKQITALGTYYGIAEVSSESISPVSDQPADVSNEPEVVINQPSEAMNQPSEVVADLPVENNTPATPETIAAFPEVTEDQTLPSGTVLNQSMLDMYRRFVENGQIIDTSLTTGEMAGISEFDSERILQLWHDYIYGRGTPEDEVLLAREAETQDEQRTSVAATAETEQKQAPAEIGVVTDENIGTLIPADEDVIYRVQLAANRTQLSQRALSRMYYGNKTVEMINENGWYKYSVGDFETYNEASQFRKSSGMTNSFIVAYRKGTRFNPLPSQELVADTAQKAIVAGAIMPEGLVFRIQVAASRVPITVAQMKKIYPGTYSVEAVSEDGWYKYQFMGVRLYSDAIQIIRSVNTPGAFIVAYEDGVKLNLAEAVRKNKDLEQTVRSKGRNNLPETEYHVQLAASRIPMNAEEIRLLYTGPEVVNVILEDGWYKYHLKAGNSPEQAEQLKKVCGIEKAFIVPYKRAAKILYYNAIHN